MDITILFGACVKTVQTTNKYMGIKENEKSTTILKSRPATDVHLRKAKDIVQQVTKLQTFLLENKAAYLNVINYLSTNKSMTEQDRSQIDQTAEEIINKCNTLITSYRQEIKDMKKSAQIEEHYNNVIDSILRYLKGVSKIYTEAKAVRVKRVVETYKLSKLETRKSNKSEHISNDMASKDFHPKKVSSYVPDIWNSTEYDNIENELTREEMEMFKSENELLYSELNALSDEVTQMESKVVHITELQELFTEKVMQQEHDIERISTTVTGATLNVRDANEQIRQAIRQNAGLRVWVLFFLLVMSFSLLFLDWYND